MYQKTRLDNGLRIITEEIREFKSTAIGIWVNTGPRNENDRNRGISHFIEHLLFKGTEKYSATDIAEIMDGVGGQLNAFTEKEQTCFYARVVDRHLPLAIEILSDMFLNSVFDPVEIERERGVILDEIRIYEDSPEDVVFEEFYTTLWDKHALACPTLGSIETVSALKREDFMKYMEDFYCPPEVIIASAGSLKHDEIVAQVSEYFGSRKSVPLPVKNGKPEFHYRNRFRYKDCEQVYLCMGGRGIVQTDDRKYALFVLDGILGGSMSSRLFQEIREKRGLVYNISTFSNSYLESAQYGIYFCTSAENLDEVIGVSNGIVDEIRENGITEKELERTREHIKGGMALSLESTSNRMIRLNKSEVHYGRYVPIDEVIEKVDAVTLEQVNEIAGEYLDRNRFATSVLGPLNEPPAGIPGEWTVAENNRKKAEV